MGDHGLQRLQVAACLSMSLSLARSFDLREAEHFSVPVGPTDVELEPFKPTARVTYAW
jgi:hypothetical protein